MNLREIFKMKTNNIEKFDKAAFKASVKQHLVTTFAADEKTASAKVW